MLFADADGATVISGLEALEAALVTPPKTRAWAHGGDPGMAVGSRAHLQQQVPRCSAPAASLTLSGSAAAVPG